MNRRVFLRTAAAGTAGAAAWSLLRVQPAAAAASANAGASPVNTGNVRNGTAKGGPAAQILPFNTGWLFGPAADGSDQPGFDDSGFATVTLPHTVVPLGWDNWDPTTWERDWSYRKHFDAPPGLVPAPDASGSASLETPRVFLDVAAAMTGSTVTLNGTRAGASAGGYLPFSVEITNLLRAKGNVLSLTLDSGFNLDVPPDQPSPAGPTAVDSWQPGGIYRDVQLRAVPRIFIS
ncbi:MAG TPA: hypothetical protein VHF26_01300, partial [Trebonia sp.]|nr:hypothetical protein [Trebonia sp.]